MAGFFEGGFGQTLETMMLIATVEGRESSASYKLIDGVPCYCADAIAFGSKPNLALLADYLRSNRPLTKETRVWLADMLDEKAAYHMNLKLTRSAAGRPKKSMMEYYGAVEFFIEKRTGKNGEHLFDSAVVETCERFRISKSTLLKAWRSLAPAIAADKKSKSEHR